VSVVLSEFGFACSGLIPRGQRTPQDTRRAGQNFFDTPMGVVSLRTLLPDDAIPWSFKL
jgi:hypothetical protein